jgi:hypothetical protein
MKRNLLFLSILILLLATACNPSDSDEYDDGDWESSSSEVSMPDDDDTPSDESILNDDDPPPPAPEDTSLLRDFTLPIPLFSPDSAWNQRADDADVLPESDAQILSLFRVLLGDISSLEGYDGTATTWPFMDVNMYEYSVPIFLAGDGRQEVLICEDDGVIGWPHPKFGIETEGGPVIVPAPAGVVRPAGPENEDADGHLVLYDPDTFTAYDYFAATTYRNDDCQGFEGGSTGKLILQAGVVDKFDVRGPGANLPGEEYSSARAVGTPLLAGLILPEDIESGVIAHALSFAIPGPRNTGRNPYEPNQSDYFYPASTTETDFYNTDPNALAVYEFATDESRHPTTAHEILQAFVDKRTKCVDGLQALPLKDLWRPGQHPEFGQLTILRQAAYLAHHEISHLSEIEALCVQTS